MPVAQEEETSRKGAKAQGEIQRLNSFKPLRLGGGF
jgi:hypothetical protein